MCGRYARFTPQHLYSQLFHAADMGMLSADADPFAFNLATGLGITLLPLEGDSDGAARQRMEGHQCTH